MPGEACRGGRSSDEGEGGPLRPTRELGSLQTRCSEFISGKPNLLQRGTQVPGPREEMGTSPSVCSSQQTGDKDRMLRLHN